MSDSPWMTTEARLTTRQAAQRMGKSVGTLKRWRQHGVGPRYLKQNARSVLYRLRDIEAWEDAKTVTSTSQTPGEPTYT